MSRTIVDLDSARLFAAVVELGSFTAAGRRLGLPKSTVSRRVSTLEEALGARLLQRTTRRLALTEVGALYFEHVERAVRELEHAEQAVLASSDAPRGTLRVTAPADFALDVLSQLFAAFVQRYPEIDTDLTLTNRRVDLIAEGYDVALRAGMLADSSLVARRVASTDFALFASAEYLARRGVPKTPQELEHHAFLSFAYGQPRGLLRLHTRGSDPGAELSVRVRGPLTCNNFDFLRKAALSGLGIASLPMFGDAPAADTTGLERVLPAYCSGSGALYAVYPSPRHLNSKVRAFIDFMSEGLAHRLQPT